ncbi:MAG: class I SAM-dependent methyltransferase [Chloroflexi bacterium]|nr:MAG: class I SAM-dependent methyltransferase [Chloroflexota bacterium]
MLAFADPIAHEIALDLGCGVGHTLRRVATRVRLAVGVDPTPGMLEGARTLLARESVTNAVLVTSPAEALPFLESTFDIATCRLAAHHFADVAKAFREVHRVLRPGGRFVLSDNYAPDDEALDRFINTLEGTRDRTHVREHTIAGWRGLLEQSGFDVTDESRGTVHIETEPWLARSRTREADARRAREMLRGAPKPTIDAFGIDERGFDLLKVVLRATR